MAGQTPVLELESLFVRIYADATQLFITTRSVEMEVNRVAARLQYILAGFAAYATYAFAKFDDALVRSMAHIRDWDQLTRPVLSRGIEALAIRSPYSPTELAGGIDRLISAGLHPAMAVQALGVAEEFALASSMNLADATQRLADVQVALGLSSEDAARHIGNLKHLTDVFLGVAPMMHSTTEQLTEAFTGRFIGALRANNLTLEEGIGLIGAYSLSQIKGASAGDAAARFLATMSRANVEHFQMWRHLEIQPFDEKAGRMKAPSAVIGEMEKAWSRWTPLQRAAAVSLMGFRREAINSINPLIGMSDAMRTLEEEVTKTDGVGHKMAEMIRNDLLVQIKVFWNNLTVVAQTIGQLFVPVVRAATEAMQQFSVWFTSLNPAMRNLIVIVPAILIGLTALGGLITLFSIFGIIVLRALYVPIGLVVGMFRVFGQVIGWIWGLFRGLASFIGSGFVAALGFLRKAVTLVVDVVWEWFNVTWKLSTAIMDAMKFFIGNMAQVLADFAKWAIGVFQSIGNIAQKIGESIAIAAISFGTGLLAFFVNLVPLFFSFILLAGLAVTIFVGLAQLGALLIAGFGSFWQGVKDGAKRAADAVVEGARRGEEAVKGMWENAKQGMAEWVAQAQVAAEKVAGFFWNFGDNIKIVWTWLRAHWPEVMSDIGKLLTLLIENTAANIKSLFMSAINTLFLPIKFVWDTVSDYLVVGFHWLSDQWANILHDMGVLFSTFMMNALRNAGTILGMLVTAIKESLGAVFDDAGMEIKIHNIGAKFWVGEEQKKREVAALFDERLKWRKEHSAEAIFAKLLDKSKFIGPLDGLKDSDLFTDFGKLWGGPGKRGEQPTGLRGAETRMVTNFLQLGNSMQGALGDAYDKLKPLFGGFQSAITQPLEPLLNLKMPADAMDRVFDGLQKMLGLNQHQEQENAPGQAFGARGPGFTLKQISLARYMLGGAAQERLDYQQLATLHAIDNKLGVLVQLQHGGRVPEIIAPFFGLKE